MSLSSVSILSAKKARKGVWTLEEDAMLVKLVSQQLSWTGVTGPALTSVNDGDQNSASNDQSQKRIDWVTVSNGLGTRSGKQCRERWINHLDPTLTKRKWTEEEDTKLLLLAETHPNKWALISRELPGRSQNQVKIRWNSLNKTYSAPSPKRVRDSEHSPVLNPNTAESDAAKKQKVARPVEAPSVIPPNYYGSFPTFMPYNLMNPGQFIPQSFMPFLMQQNGAGYPLNYLMTPPGGQPFIVPDEMMKNLTPTQTTTNENSDASN